MSNRRIGIGKGHEITTINDTYPVFHEDELVGAVEIARDITALERFVLHPLRKNSDPVTFSQIIASSDEMKTVISTARKASSAKLPVLLIGESGTGKDLIAESIHNESSPANGPFYTLYCHRSDAALIDRLDQDLNMSEPFTLFCERIDLLSISASAKSIYVFKRIPLNQDGNSLQASVTTQSN